MANIEKLTIYHEARELLRRVAEVSEEVRFGDLGSQLRRAAVSVVSNIAEGAGSGSDASFAHYLRIARGSVNEVQAQLEMASVLGSAEAAEAALLAQRVGRRMTRLIGYLRGTG